MKGIRTGFTLVELLVVMSIISLLASIMLPAMAAARRQAKTLRGINHQKSIVESLNCFAFDNQDRYPPSIATIGSRDEWWNWLPPTTMTGYPEVVQMHYRSMSAYLYDYIDDPAIMFCPNTSRQYPYIQQMWQDGESWDHPQTERQPDPMYGSYCFWWNYKGYLTEQSRVFQGPRSMAGRRHQSKILVSDYFGFDNWRFPGKYVSCEKFHSNAGTIPSYAVSVDYWYYLEKSEGVSLDSINIRLHAGYSDGHVESYSASEVTPLQVSLSPDGSEGGKGYGDFYLPLNYLY